MRRFFRFYPLTILVVLVVTTLCLMPIEDPPLKGVPFIDKWTHMALFGGIASIVTLELAINRRLDLRWLAPCAAALYGGAIELMQAYLTTCRSGEWLDFAADALGAFVVFPIALYCVRFNDFVSRRG